MSITTILTLFQVQEMSISPKNQNLLYLCTVKVEVSKIKMESQQGCEDKERIKEDKGCPKGIF